MRPKPLHLALVAALALSAWLALEWDPVRRIHPTDAGNPARGVSLATEAQESADALQGPRRVVVVLHPGRAQAGQALPTTLLDRADGQPLRWDQPVSLRLHLLASQGTYTPEAQTYFQGDNPRPRYVGDYYGLYYRLFRGEELVYEGLAPDEGRGCRLPGSAGSAPALDTGVDLYLPHIPGANRVEVFHVAGEADPTRLDPTAPQFRGSFAIGGKP